MLRSLPCQTGDRVTKLRSDAAQDEHIGSVTQNISDPRSADTSNRKRHNGAMHPFDECGRSTTAMRDMPGERQSTDAINGAHNTRTLARHAMSYRMPDRHLYALGGTLHRGSQHIHTCTALAT